MTPKSPQNSSLRGVIIPENEAGSFKQTRETLRRTSSSSSPPQKNTADFHHGHTVHSKKSYWDYLLSQFGNKPLEWTEAAPIQMITLHPRPLLHPPAHQHHHHNAHAPTHICQSNSHPSPPPSLPTPPRQPPQTPRQLNRNEWNYNPDVVGRNRIDYFGILQLNNTATKREIKVQYRRLARIYHPDKYDRSTNPTTKTESQEHFKLINNAYKFLRNF